MKNILIVDDEADIRNIIKSFLEMDGHHCEVAASGKEALEIISSKEFNIIISDIRMPGMDGVEFFDHVKKLSEKRPDFIFISGFSEYSKEELLELGAIDLLNKPEDIPGISDYINSL